MHVMVIIKKSKYDIIKIVESFEGKKIWPGDKIVFASLRVKN